MKFTFKTDKSTGPYSSFYDDHHHIKLKKIKVGSIGHKSPHKIRLQVIKKDINEDGNPNCKWKNIQLKKESLSLQDAKKYINENISKILGMYDLNLED